MKIKDIIMSTAAVLAMAVVVTACARPSKNSNVGTMVCDKTFQNIINEEIEVFEARYKEAVIGCQYVTQAEAFRRLMDGKTRLIVVGRDLTKNELTILRANRDTKIVRSMKIAVDAMALIVNPDNPIDKLSVNEIKRILSGEIKNWKQIQPGAPDLPIRIVVDDPESSVTMYMHNELMDGAPFDTTTVVTADSIPGVFNSVKRNRGAIGVVGVSWLTRNLNAPSKSIDERARQASDTSAFDVQQLNENMKAAGVKTIAVMKNSLIAYKPTQENIYRGDYPLTRPIYMITTAAPATIPGKFYTYVNSTDGQRLMMSTGVMPARVEIQVYEIGE